MIILDTHAWWWILSEPDKVSETVLEIIQNTQPGDRAIASISIWEFAMMASRGRIQLSISAEKWIDYAVNKTGIRVVELNEKIALESCTLPGEFHKDPADRIIVATTRINKATLITKDQKIIDYPCVETIW